MGLLISIGKGIDGLIIPPILVKSENRFIYVKPAYELSYEGNLYVGLFRYRSSGYGGAKYKLINDTADNTPESRKINVVKFAPDVSGWMLLPYNRVDLFRRFVWFSNDNRYVNNTRFDISGKQKVFSYGASGTPSDFVSSLDKPGKFVNTRISGTVENKFKQSVSVSLAFAFCYFGKFNENDYNGTNFAGRKRVIGEYAYCKVSIRSTINDISFRHAGFNFTSIYNKQ
jgi:hypothetical protein